MLKGATNLYPELWTAVRKTRTQIALQSSHMTYCIYAMGWIELYSHNDIGKVLNVTVLQNVYPSQALELAVLYLPSGSLGICSSVPAVTESHCRDCAGRHDLLPCPSTEAALQTPATPVWPLPLLWGCEPGYPQSPPPVIVSASWQRFSRGKQKEEGA